ncbi:MAG TPA: hypothetical protein VEU47_19170 [Candidatus Cybelea sp.]|nr:hypothetical protein [Candidatus Cybelea sp.]
MPDLASDTKAVVSAAEQFYTDGVASLQSHLDGIRRAAEASNVPQLVSVAQNIQTAFSALLAHVGQALHPAPTPPVQVPPPTGKPAASATDGQS